MQRLISQFTLEPGSVISWIGVGLIAGWLAALVTTEGGYGIQVDILLGLVGALAGGAIATAFISGDTGFWASLLTAAIVASVVIAIARILSPQSSSRWTDHPPWSGNSRRPQR